MTTDHTLLHTTPLHFLSLALGFIVALAGASAVADEALDEVSTFDIAPQPLADALLEFSQQANIQIVMVSATVKDIEAGGIVGDRTNREALELLLDDQALRYTQHDDRTVSIQTDAVIEDSASGKYQPASSSTLLAQDQMSAAQNQGTRNRQASRDSDEFDRSSLLDEIVVTGTHIRGIAPESSPTRTFDREDIQISGAATAQDFIQTLPQNFGGGSNSNRTGLPNDDNAGFNDSVSGGTFGSSINLRGLGSGSTLVLLNGHRLAPASGMGDFVDISMIPASAIERVEILTDGASSIYGGDAVAGVANFVLRKDFEGIEATVRYGQDSGNDIDESRIGVTGGITWDAGNALVVYEYFDQGNLSVADREFSQNAALPQDLLPGQERHSVLAFVSQEVSQDLDLFADLLFSSRDTERDNTTPSQTSFNETSADAVSISVGGTLKISNSWFLEFSGLYSDVKSDTKFLGELSTIEREVDSDLQTVDTRASGTVLSLPGGDLKLAIGGQFRREIFTNLRVDNDTLEREADRDIYAVFGEAFIPIIGPINAVSGIERLEINFSGRFEDYSDFGSTTEPKVGLLWAPTGSLQLRGSYSTSFKPPALGRIGADDRTAAIASTAFVNSAFGFTPGDPSIADVVVIQVSGTGENLDAEDSRAFTVGIDFDEQWGAHELVFSTTYFDIEFENRLGSTPVPDNRSFADAPNIAFNNPELFPEGSIIFSPSQSEVRNLLEGLLRFTVFDDSNPLDAEIINLTPLVRNLAISTVSGFDFNVGYAFDSDIGVFSLGLDATVLEEFKQQSAITAPVVEQINTLYNPVDLRMRGRAGYADDSFSANFFVNYVDSYSVDNSIGAATIDSWATVDLSLSYDTDDKFQNSILGDAVFRISVVNLFDEEPPLAPSEPRFGIFGFDPANASPLGRFIALELTKRW